MIPNVALDQIRHHFISNHPCKIPVFPEFPSPQSLLHFWKLFKYFCSRNTLQHSHDVCNRISWWKTQKYKHMVRSYINLLNLKLMTLRYLPKHLLNHLSYLFPSDPFPILWCPNQMIFCVVNSMSSSSDYHGVSYTTFHLPLADAPFIPAHRAGFSGAILINYSCP